ncbi:MAG: hypothetical protein Fur0037_15280 [Planctomycetota bacterium]
MRPLATSSTALAAFLASCVHVDRGSSYYPELQRALDAFRAEQRAFAESRPKTVWEFPGAGTVTVREVSLDGYPGNSYVRCKFLYRNTTRKPVSRVWVSLDVLDAEGKLVASQSSLLIVPIPIPIAKGSYFADELRTQTRGAHLRPGWSWRLACKAEFLPPEDEEGQAPGPG